ncbi:MAG: ABC transporter ATP-binding protein [Oligoflexales bacterium]|nr:ABC transporter ATP-binding protein [Oligoflexales bacterium]
MFKEIMSVRNIEKSYSSTSDFKLGPFSVSFREGESIALFGKNGAGKTTFFQIITGNLDSASGEVYFLGKKLTPDTYLLKRNMGYLPQYPELPMWVTGSELLGYACRLYEIASPEDAKRKSMEFWDCLYYSNKPIAACSHGMQKRVSLALATINDPDFLILDEPFSGLDIEHIESLKKCIRARSDRGKTTLICDHIIPYTARLCQTAYTLINGNLAPITAWKDLDFEGRINMTEGIFLKR